MFFHWKPKVSVFLKSRNIYALKSQNWGITTTSTYKQQTSQSMIVRLITPGRKALKDMVLITSAHKMHISIHIMKCRKEISHMKEPFTTWFLLYLCCLWGCYSHSHPLKGSLSWCFPGNCWSPAHWMPAFGWMWAGTPWNPLRPRAQTSPTLLLEACSLSHCCAGCNYSCASSHSSVCESDCHSHWRCAGRPGAAQTPHSQSLSSPSLPSLRCSWFLLQVFPRCSLGDWIPPVQGFVLQEGENKMEQRMCLNKELEDVQGHPERLGVLWM